MAAAAIDALARRRSGTGDGRLASTKSRDASLSLSHRPPTSPHWLTSQTHGLTWQRITRLANDRPTTPCILHLWLNNRLAVKHPKSAAIPPLAMELESLDISAPHCGPLSNAKPSVCCVHALVAVCLVPLQVNCGITRCTARTIPVGLVSDGLMVQRCIGSLAMRTVPRCCSGSASTSGSISTEAEPMAQQFDIVLLAGQEQPARTDAMLP